MTMPEKRQSLISAAKTAALGFRLDMLPAVNEMKEPPASDHSPRLRGALLVIFWGGFIAAQVWFRVVSGKMLCAAPVFLL
jgi:hypothetical protein